MGIRSTLCNDRATASHGDWVRETRVGRWFVGTDIWRRYVLVEAVLDLRRLLGAGYAGGGRLLDAGCGIGLAFPLLEQYLRPEVIVGVDIDEEMTAVATTRARDCRCQVVLETTSIVELNYPDQSFDMIFSHQFLHHIIDQENAARNFYRLLAPGGVVLIGESCRPFIRSLPVRLLFRHPMIVQKTAAQYVDLIRSIGFEVGEHDVETSTPWWSRRDLGLLERLGFSGKRSLQAAEVLIVGKKNA